MVSDRTASTRQIAANILLALLIFAFIWGCVAASLLVFPLLEGGGMSLPEMASTLGITTVILCPLVFLSGGMLLGLRALAQKRVSGHLDPMFEALGFSGMPSGLGITGRRIYHGVVGGRRVNVRYARTYRSRGGTRAATYRGSTVTVVVEAPSLATRMGIGLRTALSNALNRFIKREEIPLDDPGYEDLIAYALDEDWTRALLSHEEGRELIRSLMADPLANATPQIQVQPGALIVRVLRVLERQITPEAVRRWVEGAVRLADVAEALPAPRERVEANRAEERLRSGEERPIRDVLLGFGILVGVMAVLALPAVACVGLSALAAAVQ